MKSMKGARRALAVVAPAAVALAQSTTTAGPPPPQGGSSVVSPVLLLPGLGGSGLEARCLGKPAEGTVSGCDDLLASFEGDSLILVNGTEAPAPFRLWFSLNSFGPTRQRQLGWLNDMHLQYEAAGPAGLLAPVVPSQSSADNSGEIAFIGRWTNPQGLDVTPIPGLPGVDYLDSIGDIPLSFTRYYHDIISTLIAQGYQRDVDLKAFPYDWRYPVWQHDWNRLREMIESLYYGLPGLNPERPVVIVLHSMGMLVLNYFLAHKVPVGWADKYIDKVIAINPATGGSFKAIRSLISGYNPADIPWISHSHLVPRITSADMTGLSRSFGSLLALLPSEQVYSRELPVIELEPGVDKSAVDPTKPSVYTLANWTALLPPDVTKMVSRSRQLLQDLNTRDPQVPIYCLFSSSDGNNTEVSYTYSTLNDDPKNFVYSTGDGTLPTASLDVCRTWKSTILAKEYPDSDHMYLLRQESLLHDLSQIIMGDQPENQAP